MKFRTETILVNVKKKTYIVVDESVTIHDLISVFLMNLLLLISAIALLLIISCFFSAAETGITSVSASRMHKLKLQGTPKASKICNLLKKKEQVIATILLGNTIVNIMASSISTILFISFFGNQGIALSTTLMTLLILLFSEILPKTYAIQNPEKTALLTSKILTVLVYILSPIMISMQFIVDLILKILNLHKDREIISAAEAMRNLILLHSTEKTMLKQDIDMLNSVLDLAETEISQIMTHRKNLFSLNIDQPLDTLLKNILTNTHSRVPLWKEREDNIVGVVHVKDLINLLRKQKDEEKIEIHKIMIRPWFIPDTTLLTVQLHNFRKKRQHCALVIDEYGDLQGIVTLEDILEEIVGDISDEHDVVEDNLISKINDNTYNINGETPIRDINRQLSWNLPDDEASTLAGLLFHKIERIPDENEEFCFDGFNFKVLSKIGNILATIQVDHLSNK